MAAKILTTEPQRDPVWMRALDRYEIAVVGWVAVAIAVWSWGGKWVDVMLDGRRQEQAETSKFLQAQIESTMAQTRAVEKLVQREDATMVFQENVLKKHDHQTSVLESIDANTGDTNERMRSAEEAMAGVPAQRDEMVSLLQQISESLKAQDDG